MSLLRWILTPNDQLINLIDETKGFFVKMVVFSVCAQIILNPPTVKLLRGPLPIQFAN